MGGLVVKQMLHKAKTEKIDNFVKNTVGLVCFTSSFSNWILTLPFYKFLILTCISWILYHDFRCFIAAHILEANLQTCLGEWALSFVQHQLLVQDLQ